MSQQKEVLARAKAEIAGQAALKAKIDELGKELARVRTQDPSSFHPPRSSLAPSSNSNAVQSPMLRTQHRISLRSPLTTSFTHNNTANAAGGLFPPPMNAKVGSPMIVMPDGIPHNQSAPVYHQYGRYPPASNHGDFYQLNNSNVGCSPRSTSTTGPGGWSELGGTSSYNSQFQQNSHPINTNYVLPYATTQQFPLNTVNTTMQGMPMVPMNNAAPLYYTPNQQPRPIQRRRHPPLQQQQP